MAANAALQPVNETGWRMGFANLLRKENGAWWRTRSWLIQSVIWLAILNGILATLLWAAPDEANVQLPSAGEPTATERLMADNASAGLFVFIIMAGVAPAIGTVIIGQDAIIDEKRSGTAAWVLSKPVSRSAFVLAKLVAHGLGILITAVVLQGVIAYLQLAAAGGGSITPLGFAGAMGLVFLNLMFYLTLTLMLGALFNSRGPVIGIPMALLFGYQLILGLAPWLAEIMPWALTTNTHPASLPLAIAAAFGQPLPSTTTFIATLIWCVVFTAVALWRFNREEF